MTSLLWDTTFDPSIETIMIQRKTISSCLNAIHEGFNDLGRSCASINEMLEQLKLTCRNHFSFAEKLFEELNYPPAAKQKERHDSFLNDIETLKCTDDRCHSAAVISDFLKLRLEYITNTNNETMMLCDYLKEIPVRT